MMLEKEETENHVSEKPKRYGKVPANFDNVQIGATPSVQEYEECAN